MHAVFSIRLLSLRQKSETQKSAGEKIYENSGL